MANSDNSTIFATLFTDECENLQEENRQLKNIIIRLIEKHGNFVGPEIPPDVEGLLNHYAVKVDSGRIYLESKT